MSELEISSISVSTVTKQLRIFIIKIHDVYNFPYHALVIFFWKTQINRQLLGNGFQQFWSGPELLNPISRIVLSNSFPLRLTIIGKWFIKRNLRENDLNKNCLEFRLIMQMKCWPIARRVYKFAVLHNLHLICIRFQNVSTLDVWR